MEKEILEKNSIIRKKENNIEFMLEKFSIEKQKKIDIEKDQKRIEIAKQSLDDELKNKEIKKRVTVPQLLKFLKGSL